MFLKKMTALFLAGSLAVLSLVSCGILVSESGPDDRVEAEDDTVGMISLFRSGMKSFARELFKVYNIGAGFSASEDDSTADPGTYRISSEFDVNILTIFDTKVITPERRFTTKSDSYYDFSSLEAYTAVTTSFSGEELFMELYRHSRRTELSAPGLTDKLLVLPCCGFLPFDLTEYLSAGVKVDDSCFRFENVPYRNGDIECYDSELLELTVPDSSLVIPVFTFKNNKVNYLTVRSISLHFSEGKVFAADISAEKDGVHFLLRAAVWNGYDSSDVKMDFYLKDETDLNLVSLDLNLGLDPEKNMTGSFSFYADTAMLGSMGLADDFGINDLSIEAEINSFTEGKKRTSEIESVIEYDIYGISNRIDLPVRMESEEQDGGLEILLTAGHSDDEITEFGCSLKVVVSKTTGLGIKSASQNILENNSLYFLNGDDSYESIRSDIYKSFKKKYRYISSLFILDDRGNDNAPISMLCAYDADEKTTYVIYFDRDTFKGNGDRTVCLNYSYAENEVQVCDERGNIVFLLSRNDLITAESDSEGIHITDSVGRKFTFKDSGKCYVSTPIVISVEELGTDGSYSVDYSYLYKTRVNRRATVNMSGGYIVASGSDKKIRYLIY